MKTPFLFAIALLLPGVGWTQQTDGQDHLDKEVRSPRPVEPWQGTIFSGDLAAGTFPPGFADSFWTPTQEQVKELEIRLRAFLAEVPREPMGETKKGTLAQAQRILEHLGEYRRQYIGVVRNGSKRILVNCFPLSRPGEEDPFPSWRHQLVTVADGGFWFWSVEYEVKSKRFVELESDRQAEA